MKLAVYPMDDYRREDFYRVHSEENGHGWCCCVAWWTPTWDGWADRSASENRKLREELFERGEYDGYLLYVDDSPVGWCQCGPRDRLEKLCSSYRLEPDADAWAITCFVLAPKYRGIGLAHFFLAETLKDLERRGVKYVHAFPRRGTELPDDDVWTGPEMLFKKTGFTLYREHPAYPVYCKRFDQVRC
ncbi:MAG: GNAT family N-acetyltransferase [Candidatus Zixiibacteriota bacterium]|nr:MAG: GNAT family N-acetyltransferase [candidate division Zixibacteria bacterium]